MFIKRDYDYVELKQFVSPENHDIYNLIKDNHQQDNFVLTMYKFLDDTVLTPEEFDYFLSIHKEGLKRILKLKG